MTGQAELPVPSAVISGVENLSGQSKLVSATNSQRIAFVAERLNAVLHSAGKGNPMDIFRFCLALSRGIDYAVANNEVPYKAQQLPVLLKQICQHKNDYIVQAAVMVLMISVKNACDFGWFSMNDTKELQALATQVGSSFGSVVNFTPNLKEAHPIITKIMTRFYPLMRIGQIIASLEIKPGYGAYLVDFHLSKNIKFSPRVKIRLFVAQTDNIETSSCIISPPDVNFLLNGKGVERRTNIMMDHGPQVPTNVTGMLKYGTNLLQVVGQFNGHYLIIIAFMSTISHPQTVPLLDYVQPAAATLDSDSEIIEGPSRVSLNCPISLSRIRTPVKGHLCKHFQCFDFDNFVEINSRRPAWRCAHCNQHVCYTDIRIDQNMVKILREVAKNVADVIIFEDGSWKTLLESNDHPDQPQNNGPRCLEEESEDKESSNFSNMVTDVVDLVGDDDMDVAVVDEAEDRKPFPANLPYLSTGLNLPGDLTCNNNAQNFQLDDSFWLGVYLSTSDSMISNAQTNVGISEPPPCSNNLISPVLTDAVSPALSRENHELRLQQVQFGQSVAANEYGRPPSIIRHVNRTPTAIQALPAQPPGQPRPRNGLNSFRQNVSPPPQASGSMASSPADGFKTMGSDPHQISRSIANPHLVPETVSSSLQHHLASQNWNHQDNLFMAAQSGQQIAGFSAPGQPTGSYRLPSSGHPIDHNPQQFQPMNTGIPQNTASSPGMNWPSAHLPRTQIPHAGLNHQQARLAIAAQRAAMFARLSQSRQAPRPASPLPASANGLRPPAVERGVNPQAVSRAEDLLDPSPEQNWRPTGRMRGSLLGRHYSDALGQLIIQPTQHQQKQPPPPARPVPGPPPPGLPPQLHALVTNHRFAHGPQPPNHP